MPRSLKASLEDKLVYSSVAAWTLIKFVGGVALFIVGSLFASLINKQTNPENADLTQ